MRESATVQGGYGAEPQAEPVAACAEEKHMARTLTSR